MRKAMSLSKKDDTLLRASEEIDTKHLVTKRSYSAMLIKAPEGIEIDKVIWSKISDHVFSKTIYVKLCPEDIDVTDLLKSKAFFRAKLTLRLAGDRP